MHNGAYFQHVGQTFQEIGCFNKKSGSYVSKFLDNKKQKMGDFGAINCED